MRSPKYGSANRTLIGRLGQELWDAANSLEASRCSIGRTIQLVSTDTIAVLDRALMVLRQLATRPDGYSLPDLTADLGMSKSTTRRFLQTLCKQGFADFDAERQRYTLGMLILGLSTGLAQQNVLAVAVHPALEALQQRTGETAALWLRMRFFALCLSSIESPLFVRTVSPIGRSIPLYAGAHGKMLLAGMDAAEMDDYLRITELTPLTPATLVDPEQLIAAVVRIRREGHAVSHGEVNADVTGVAAPVLDPTGRIIACLSVTAPSHRVDDVALSELVDAVKDAAVDATRRTSGHRGAPVSS
jgi:DNA-binding IclR family transcriptional regulator